jgi:Glycosyltransferase WbsX
MKNHRDGKSETVGLSRTLEIVHQISWAFLIVFGIVSAVLMSGCGGGSGVSTGPPPNPTPTIAALSPNSSDQGGPAFTLSVVGSNFISGSSLQWNGSSLPTTFVSGALLTAAVPASAVAGAGPDSVTVVNPAPGGGASNSLNFAVPCVIVSAAAASTQTRARLGAFYFDGWSGPLTNFHFQGLPLGPYQDRQPFSGWQDSSQCAVEQQLASAHNFGIDFFVFDWYFNVQVNDPGENLNSALQITHALPDRHGMQYAILYVDGAPFDVGPADWTSAVNEWVGYMTDPDYVRVNGEPAFFIINVGEMRQVFGSSAAVSSALAQLRAAAQAQGLPGVYIVGGFGTPDGTMGQESLDNGFLIAGQDGYDAVAFYNYPFAPTPVNGMLPFSTLSQAGQWTWNQAQLHCPVPSIPTAMVGWDPRPWNETEPNTGDLMWYSRTPQEVATFFQDAIAWATANPPLRPEPAPSPPLVLIEAWNEFGEGSYVIPTVGDGTSYGDAIAAMLTAP